MRASRVLPLLAFSMSFGAPPAAAQQFEGVVRQRYLHLGEEAVFDLLFADGDEEPEFDSDAEWLRFTAGRLMALPMERLVQQASDASTTVMYIKGLWVRGESEDMPSGSYFLSDGEAGTATFVVPDRKAFVRLTGPGEGMEDFPEWDEPEWEVRELGRSETVNGFRAAAVEAVREGGYAMGWCASDDHGIQDAMIRIGASMSFLGDEGEEGDPGLEDSLCGDRLPVRILTFTVDDFGQSYSVEEYLGVERRALDAGRFAIPEGYQEITLEDLYRGN